MNQAASFESWYDDLHNELVDLGLCYDHGQISVSPLVLSSALVGSWVEELPQLLALARRVALRDLRVPSEHRELIEVYSARPLLPGIMRPDGILVGGELKLLDFNVDSAVGGIWEVNFLQSKLERNPELRASSGSYFPKSQTGVQTFLNEIASQVASSEGPVEVALVGYSDFDRLYRDLTQEICDWVNASDVVHATFTTPEQLRCEEYVTDGVRRFHCLYRIGALLHSAQRCAPMLSLLRAAASTKTAVLSDPRDLAIDHKIVLAQLHELADTPEALSPHEQRLVRKYVPWTCMVQPGKTRFEGRHVSISDLATTAQSRFVLKRAQSRIGEHVFMGSELPASQWRDLVTHALLDSTPWVLQESLEAEPYPFEYYIPGEGLRLDPRRYTVSPFMFGRHLGGVLVRVEEDHNRRVLALPYNSAMGSAGVMIGATEASS